MNWLKTNVAKIPACYRQGDVFIVSVSSIDKSKVRPRSPILAEGEVTGHAHRLSEPDRAQVYGDDTGFYLDVTSETATIVHDEHAPIHVPHGQYAVRIQREYTPKEIRRVVD